MENDFKENNIVTVNNASVVTRSAEMKTRKKKYSIIVVIISALIVLSVFSVFFVISQIPNKSSNEEFIIAASKIVTVDSENYKRVIKAEKAITNLKKVILWGNKGKATYEFDSKKDM